MQYIILFVVAVIVLFSSKPLTDFVRSRRIASLAKEFGLNYKYGDKSKITFFANAVYKRNFLDGVINGHTINSYDVILGYNSRVAGLGTHDNTENYYHTVITSDSANADPDPWTGLLPVYKMRKILSDIKTK